MHFISTHATFLRSTFLLSKQQTQRPSRTTPYNTSGTQGGQGLSLLNYTCKIGFKDLTSFLPSFTCCLPVPNGFLKTSLFLKSQMSHFFLATPTEKTGNTRCEMSLFVPLHSTHTSCGLLSLLVVSGLLPCHLSAGSHLFSHTQDHNLSLGGWFASIHSILGYDQTESFSQPRPAHLKRDFRTKRK